MSNYERVAEDWKRANPRSSSRFLAIREEDQKVCGHGVTDVDAAIAAVDASEATGTLRFVEIPDADGRGNGPQGLRSPARDCA